MLLADKRALMLVLAVDHGQKSYFSRRLEVFSSIKVITTTGGGNFLKLKVQKKKESSKVQGIHCSCYVHFTLKKCAFVLFLSCREGIYTQLYFVAAAEVKSLS